MVFKAPVGISDTYPAQFIIYPLCIASLLIPAPVHFKSGNTGVILFIIYALSAQISLLVDAIIWRGNVSDPVPYWCDLSTFIIAIVPTGLAAAVLCVTRQLHRLSKAQAVIISQREKRKQLAIDLSVGVLLPLLVGGGHAIIQGHRYDIWEDVGCMPTTYNVAPAYPLYMMWPLLVSLISTVYGLLALRQFLKRRKTFEMLLSSNSSGMQKNRYIRLMWLCCIDLVFVIPYHTYILAYNVASSPVDAWVSWEVTQFDWYRVDFYRRIIIDSSPLLRFALLSTIFMQSIISLVFLILFGFTRETTKAYKNAFYWCMQPFGIKKPQRSTAIVNAKPPRRGWIDKLLGRDAIPLNSTTNTTGSLPIFASQIQSPKESRSIPSARPKQPPTNSVTDTLNWDDEDTTTDSHHSVMVIDGRRLTIPGLNAMASFDSDDMYDEKSRTTTSPPGMSYNTHSHSPV